MIRSDAAISRFRRDLTMGTIVKVLLAGGAIACLFLEGMLNIPLSTPMILAAIGIVWLVLSYRSAKGSQAAAELPSLISAGRFDEAEQHLDDALRSFSLFRAMKLLTLHHLALLRHAQKRWQDSAQLSRALLGQRLGTAQALVKPSRLMLADALLELGDVRGVYDTINALYNQRLTLGEALSLLTIQLDYESRIGAWDHMLRGVNTKIQLAELMPSAKAARTQALLALAAKKTGNAALSNWLRRRAELLMDVQQLASQRKLLWELWERNDE